MELGRQFAQGKPSRRQWSHEAIRQRLVDGSGCRWKLRGGVQRESEAVRPQQQTNVAVDGSWEGSSREANGAVAKAAVRQFARSLWVGQTITRSPGSVSEGRCDGYDGGGDGSDGGEIGWRVDEGGCDATRRFGKAAIMTQRRLT